MNQKNACEILVLGGANMDYLVRGQTLPKPGETAMGEVFQEAPGGKGANQAVAARRLGAQAALIARVGADERGKAIRKRLEDEGIDTTYVFEDAKESTGVALIMVEQGGEKEILTAPGANRNIDIDHVQEARSLIQSAQILLTQLEIPLDAVMTAVRLAHQAGAKVVLDPSPPVSLPDELLGMLNVIKPNAREAEALTGIQVQDRSSAWKAAKRLLEHGAGDAFAAALSVGLLEGRSWQQAGDWASAAAALTTTRLGAQAGLPRRDQILALLDQEKSKG